MDEPAGSAGRAEKARIEGFQQQWAAENVKRDHRPECDGDYQVQVGGRDTEDVAKKKMGEVEPGRQATEQGDAHGKKHEEQSSEGGVFFDHRQSADDRATERGEETCEQRADQKRRRAGTAQQPRQRDARQ